MSLIGSLRQLFNKREKILLCGLLSLSILVSVIETVGISGLMFFITLATNFEMIQKNKYFSAAYTISRATHPAYFVAMIGIGLIVFYCIRAVLNIFLVYSLSRFSQMRQHRFTTENFKRFLMLDYKEFTCQNGTFLSQGIFTFTGNVTQILNGMLNIMSESFTICAIYAMLFYVNWKMTLVLSVLLALKVFFIIKTFSNRITTAGKKAQEFSARINRLFGAVHSNYKFLKLLATPRREYHKFEAINLHVINANNVNAVWQTLPRFILETIGFIVLIGVIVYVLSLYKSAQAVIPIVSMYALAFYRFLPSISKILAGYNQIIFNKHAVASLVKYQSLVEEELYEKSLAFNKNIELRNVSFSYVEGNPIFNNASLQIKKGEKVGFIGQSGAGKTTLVDVLIGLLKPEKGQLVVDGIAVNVEHVFAWRRQIGYIPQTISLFDGTAAENILCGRVRHDEELIKVLKQANVYDFLLARGGLDSSVGDAGIQLSGGQRQRLAIARALYGDPSILVLDEATSSLDNENEARIMDEIYNSAEGRTMLVIAHRLSTIARCDRVFEVKDGVVFEVNVPNAYAAANVAQSAQL
ncbi:ABC transporter ATP-binding protein [Candidatus Dependentiae bacterium]|nr:ABC transporter ATP-binding protein [Candidatus Dependentiae bacterium]